jgi:multidrug resistance efflux pump
MLRAVVVGWLAQLGRALRHMIAADVVDVPEQGAAVRLASWPDRSQSEALVLDIARRAVQAKKYLAELPVSDPQSRVLAVPLVLAGLPRCVIVARLPRREEGVAVDLKDLLQASAWLRPLLDAARTPGPAAPAAPSAKVGSRPQETLELLVTALEQREPAAATIAVANRLAALLGADRVSVGLRQGRQVQLMAISGSAGFDRATASSCALRDALREAVEQGVSLAVPEPPGASPRHDAAQRILLRQSQSAAVLTVPFADGARMAGAVTIEWRAIAADAATQRERAESMLALVGPVLATLQRAQLGLAARLRESALATVRAVFGPRRPVLKLAGLLGAVLLVVGSVVHVPHRVSGSAVLRGSVQRVVLAPVEGFIATAPARPGDVVQRDAVLATLDDEALHLEAAKWQAEYDRVLNEYREALSLLDSAKVAVLRASLDRTLAELELAEDNLARSEIRAPIDGVVVSGDFSQSIGAPVQRGMTLFELAPLDGYRVSVRVRETEVGRLRAGQRGRLVLAALPGRPLEMVVDRVTPVAEVVEGRNVFEIEARLLRSPAELRPGMQGVAKFEVGSARLLWLWTHDSLDWLQLKLWAIGVWR